MTWAKHFGRLGPWFAAVAILLALTVVPFGAPMANWHAAAVATVGVFALLSARLGAPGDWNSIALWPVVAVLLATAASTAACSSPVLAAERMRLLPLFALIFPLAQVASWSRNALQLVCWSGVLAVLLVVVDVCWSAAMGEPLLREGTASQGRFSASQGNANDLAAVSILLPLALPVLPTRCRQWAYPLCCMIAALPWILSAGRQAMAGWFVSSVVPLATQFRTKQFLLSSAGLLVLSVTVIAVVPSLRERAIETYQLGLDSRAILAAFGWSLFWQHPLTGNGPGLFGEAFLEAARAGWTWQGQMLPRTRMPWVHCLPLEVLSDLGVVGALAYGAVVFAAARRVWRLIRDNECSRPLGVAVGTMLISGLLVSLVDMSFIKEWVCCVFWLTLGLAFARSPRNPSVAAG